MAPPTSRRRRRPLAAALLVLVVVAASSCSDDEPAATAQDESGTDAADGCTATTSETTSDIAYRSLPGVDPDLLSLDLTVPDLPEGCPDPPLLVWVHGGAFRAGDKANATADKIRMATANGWAFASVNYRLSPPQGAEVPDPVRHPAHAEDVSAAVAWLRDEGAAHGVDGGRIALAGHSAGAFLVSLVGTDATYLEATGGGLDDLSCVISDDTTYDIAAGVADGGYAEVMFRGAFGDDPEVWRAASPMTTAATGGAPPFLVITRGTRARMAESVAFAEVLRDAGGTAEVLDARPLDHDEVNRHIGTADDDVVTPTFVATVTDCLADG